MRPLIKNQGLRFLFNPFGGLSAEEIEQVIVPRFDKEEMLQRILDAKPKIIEFVGKQGRGKTMHLTLLHELLAEYPLVLLSARNNTLDIAALQTPILFIDSIHHLSLRQRIRLYKHVPTIVLTTHHRRALEYAIARKTYQSISFNSIDIDILRQLLISRIQLALPPTDNPIELEEAVLQRLLQKYNDDYRGILNYLYDEFQNNTI